MKGSTLHRSGLTREKMGLLASLTNSDKTAINAENGRTIDSIYSSASVGGVPWAITYDSGSV